MVGIWGMEGVGQEALDVEASCQKVKLRVARLSQTSRNPLRTERRGMLRCIWLAALYRDCLIGGEQEKHGELAHSLKNA